MTERGEEHVTRDDASLRIGPSGLAWNGRLLDIELDEWSAPFPRRIRGRIRLVPDALQPQSFSLSACEQHHWRPIAPSARMTVELDHPGLTWQGNAYVDSNWGAAPLEDAFQSWNWSRARLADGSTAVIYDLKRRDQTDLALALLFGTAGGFEQFVPPKLRQLPGSNWKLRQATRAEGEPRIVEKLEDGPFYARNLVQSQILGQAVSAVHESLDLDRFDSRWVQALLPFRMPRAWGATRT